MRTPIRIKFSALIFLLIFTITATVLWITIHRVRESLTNEIELQGEILARNIALNAADPLSTNDDLYLAILVRDATENEGVGYAYLVDNKGIIRAHNEIKFVNKPDKAFTPPSNLYNVTIPILLAGKKEIGKVSVGLGTERIKSTTNTMQLILIFIAIAGLFFGILGAVLLSNYLTNPIKELVQGVHAIAKSNFEQRIARRSNDEIGDLTSAFNNMAESLKEKEQIKDAFRRYVSHQVAEEIFKDPSEYIETLKGTRRKVTILFADIRDFTPLAERLPAERVVILLNEALTIMTEIVFKYGGTIDKFIGDCIMAVFGAPLIHTDDIDRAILVAVEIQKAIKNINNKRFESSEEKIKIGIGINVGEAVVGNIGARDRLDYTVIGDSVNLASRLEKTAKGGEILVSEPVFKEARGKYTFIGPKLVKLKGKGKPVRCYSVAI
jgi:adenylate cyclase